MRDGTRAWAGAGAVGYTTHQSGSQPAQPVTAAETTTHVGMCNVASAGSGLKIIFSPKKPTCDFLECLSFFPLVLMHCHK